MYFVHPQIKINKENLKSVFNCFFERPNLERLRYTLSSYFPEKKIIFTDMGRTAFQLIIEKLNLRNTQMLVPAYICDIFFGIFKKYNIQPIFLDIDTETFNIKAEQIKQKANPGVKSILLPHTYGLANDIEKIKSLTNNQLLIIEDCAHTFGAKYNNGYLGNFGNAAFFSLYKIFPTCRGGIAILPSDLDLRQEDLIKTKFSFRDFISLLNCFSLFAFLFKSFGSSFPGQLTAQKMIRKEKFFQPSQINRVSLNLFQHFLKNHQKNLEKRIKLALFFQTELRKLGFKVQNSQNNSFGYLSALVPKNLNRDALVKKLRKHKIFCTRIWHSPIILNPEVQKQYHLDLDKFPNTIETAKRIINLPLQNYFEKKDIENIIKALKRTVPAHCLQ